MILFLLSHLASQPASPPAAQPVVRVGTYSYPRYDRRVALEPLAAMIERVSGRSTQIVLLDTPDALADAVCSGDVDVAMTNLGAFVKIRSCPEIKAIAVLDTPPTVLDSYRGVLLSRRDVDVANLEGLAARAGGLHYSEVLPGSTSGALVQRAILRSVKTKPSSFLSVRQAGTHDAALDDCSRAVPMWLQWPKSHGKIFSSNIPHLLPSFVCYGGRIRFQWGRSFARTACEHHVTPSGRHCSDLPATRSRVPCRTDGRKRRGLSGFAPMTLLAMKHFMRSDGFRPRKLRRFGRGTFSP